MKYYMVINGQQAGPYEESELLGQGLTRSTLVWREGWSQWTAAGEVPELKYLFGAVPPPVAPQYPPQQPVSYVPDMPKTWLTQAILVTIFLCVPFGIVGIVKASHVGRLYARGDYQAAEEYSKAAGKWVKLGFWIGLAVWIIYVIYLVVLLIVGTGAAASYYY